MLLSIHKLLTIPTMDTQVEVYEDERDYDQEAKDATLTE